MNFRSFNIGLCLAAPLAFVFISAQHTQAAGSWPEDASRMGVLVTPAKQNVPNYETRQAMGVYTRMPGWKNLEFVRDGVLNESLLKTTSLERWSGGVAIFDFKWLQLRDLDIHLPGVTISKDIVDIPFVVDLRYQQARGLSQIFMQGTINVSGRIYLRVSAGRIVGVDVSSFNDSQLVERLGRKLGIIDHFDENFVHGVIHNSLQTYLSEPGNLSQLIGLIDPMGSMIVIQP